MRLSSNLNQLLCTAYLLCFASCLSALWVELHRHHEHATGNFHSCLNEAALVSSAHRRSRPLLKPALPQGSTLLTGCYTDPACCCYHSLRRCLRWQDSLARFDLNFRAYFCFSYRRLGNRCCLAHQFQDQFTSRHLRPLMRVGRCWSWRILRF